MQKLDREKLLMNKAHKKLAIGETLREKFSKENFVELLNSYSSYLLNSPNIFTVKLLCYTVYIPQLFHLNLKHLGWFLEYCNQIKYIQIT